MAEEASNDGLFGEVHKHICWVVATYGGDAAHPQTNPSRNVGRETALTTIAMTATVLRSLYP